MSTIIAGPPCLDRGVAAVDEQIAAGHERRGVAGQIEGGARDLLGQPEPAQQVLGPHVLSRVVHVLPATEHPPGLDGARRDRVGADVLRGVVGGEHLRELDQGALRRAVGPPPASIWAAVVLAPGSSMSAHATRAPAAAKARAVARPMPFAAPTTMAVFFSSVNAGSFMTASISARATVYSDPAVR